MQTNRLYIPVEIAGHKCRAFIDTGADISLTTQAVMDLLGLNITEKIQGEMVMKGVGGGQKVLGYSSCNVNISDYQCMVKFSVLEEMGFDKYLILLGRDFLHPYSCIIDFGKNSLNVQGHTVSFLDYEQSQTLDIPINATKTEITTMIKSLSELADITILAKIVNNILLHPNEDKYCSINSKNKSIQAIISNSCGKEFIQKLGFQMFDDNLILIDNDQEVLRNAQSILRDFVF